MKKLMSSRWLQWGSVLALVCGAAFLTQSITENEEGTSWFTLGTKTAEGVLHSSEGVKPAGAKLAEPVPSVPAPSPAPPSLPAKPVERPAPEPLSKRVVEYHLNAELDAEGKLITATSSVTWTNSGTKPVQELYLHLYPNAFESKNSTFMQESGGRLRSDQQQENSFGSMQISSITSETGEPLLPKASYVSPDDGNPNDKTLLMLPLTEPVAPGGKITLKTAFTVKLPFVFARMGYAGDFVMAGQWFPKIAVYETAGTRGRSEEGWNLHQYHGNSEFYSDFGIYNVRIKVPSSYTVAATGFPTKPAADDGKHKTYSFYADDVHDFAWAASPHFIYHEEPYSTKHLPGVRIKLYLDPKHEHLKDRYMTAAKKALARYSEWYGSYPYSTLSIVVPPSEGNGAGGMEYPSLVTAWGAADEDPSLELERVVVHEIGHQFWYGIVASNEFEEAWLDEGFTSYAEDKLMQAEYGVKPNLLLEASYMTHPAPLNQNAWSYESHQHYAENVYTRAKLVLTAIERQVGEPAMKKIMRTYFAKWKFKHPSTADFAKVVSDVTKQNWEPFFEQYVYGGLMTDYAVTGMKSERITQDGQPAYDNWVKIRRQGGIQENVPVRLHFSDGTFMDKVWQGTDSEVIMKINHTAPLKWVMIDPEFTMVLENKRINSFMHLEAEPKLALRWSIGTAKLLEALAGWLAW